MKVVYLGSGEFGIECLNALAQSVYSPELIVTQSVQRAGRGRKPRPTPVARWAKEHSLDCIETNDVNTSQVIDRIAATRPDLMVVIAFGQKIGNRLINLPKKGAINIHGSLLPKYRGAAPVNWAIINGESKTGVTVITLAEKIDAGDILAQTETEIAGNETAGRLSARLAGIASPLLLDTIQKIEEGKAVYTPQVDSNATPAPKLKKSDGFLDFAEPAEAVKRKILGFWPWPGASALYLSEQTGKEKRVTIAIAEVIETTNPSETQPGKFDENLNVVCGQNALKITEIKPSGSSLMDFRDFVNGHRTQPGDVLLKIKK